MGLMPAFLSQAWKSPAMNSGPLSDRRYSGFPMFEEQGVESVENLGMSHLGGDCNVESLTRIFIENSEHLVTPAAAQLVMHEINAPDVVRMLRS